MLFLVVACAQFGQHEAQNTDYGIMMQNARTYSDHDKLTHYYEDQAKQMKLKAEEKKKALADYEDHSYVYGRQGQDFASHTHANIRYYEQAADEAVKQAGYHRRIAANLMKIESEKQAILPNQKDSQRNKTQLSSDSSNKR
jgi:hypothetical protein